MKKQLFYQIFWQKRVALQLLTKSFNWIFLVFLFLNTVAQAQEITVSGMVSDSNGLPLPGVTVIEKGVNNGVQTDFDGIFTG